MTDTDHTTASPVRSGPRVGTVVWGIILLLLGLGVLGVGAGLTVDLQAALIALLALAGVGLLVKALLTRSD
ncbi:hypothetical protein SAMN05216184_103208 [Georgenia satyanarayanai]|uniref:Uncharacterized protein n=1 Tax=Georgenia satyanarayanai TaxID=860221 RepID=A0A2Y9A6E8_9MICO|nr:hypothetical protein [Georgenia satyanarayanai]PYG00635.1 hypothetical protein A8987_103208 [Georgenia satyanarayanai]SSA40024.1 hypothetical protein SAMN05216184_103208 [Georgenia satyanarayanai]